MKVCLILPPRLVVKDYRPPEASPPLGLALISGVLLKAGHEVVVIDAIGEAEEQTNELEFTINSDKLPKSKTLLTMGLSPKEIGDRVPVDAQIIGISCMFTFNWIADRALLDYLKGRFPNAIYIAGGESISGMGEQCLIQCPALNICAIGEGEETMLEIIDAVEGKVAYDQVNSIIFRGENGFVKTPKRARMKNLEEIPFPAWQLFPVEKYHKLRTNEENGDLKVTLPLIATRGCPYSCTFCTSPDMWGTRYYMRTPQHVLEEILYLKENFNAHIIEFYDLTAIIKKEWIMEFSNLLIEHKVNINWRIPAGTRSEAIDGEVAHNLQASGCYSITYAPESGSPRLLKLIKKKVNLDRMLLSMKQVQAEGMRVHLNMIMGLPDETHGDIWRTMWFLVKCRRIGVKSVPFHVFRPYPGSALFDRVLKEGRIQLDNDDYLIDSLLIIQTNWENTFYNDNISKFWYAKYHKLLDVAFYGSGYVMRPLSIFKSIKNIMTQNYENSFEHAMSFKYERFKARLNSTFSR